jgi:uncharacterized membrane protein YfcA
LCCLPVNAAKESVEICEVSSNCTSAFDICKEKVCVHKFIFPILPVEIWGVLAFLFIKAASTVAGIGGGGIVIPMVIYFFGFTTKPAIAVSSFSTFTATIGSFLFSFRHRHPEKPNMVMIDYGLTCIMMPTTLAGAQIGAFILIVCPPVII